MILNYLIVFLHLHRRYIFSGKAICCIWNKHTCFAHCTITNYDTFDRSSWGHDEFFGKKLLSVFPSCNKFKDFLWENVAENILRFLTVVVIEKHRPKEFYISCNFRAIKISLVYFKTNGKSYVTALQKNICGFRFETNSWEIMAFTRNKTHIFFASSRR